MLSGLLQREKSFLLNDGKLSLQVSTFQIATGFQISKFLLIFGTLFLQCDVHSELGNFESIGFSFLGLFQIIRLYCCCCFAGFSEENLVFLCAMPILYFHFSCSHFCSNFSGRSDLSDGRFPHRSSGTGSCKEQI